jgi:hypothetical protein
VLVNPVKKGHNNKMHCVTRRKQVQSQVEWKHKKRNGVDMELKINSRNYKIGVSSRKSFFYRLKLTIPEYLLENNNLL